MAGLLPCIMSDVVYALYDLCACSASLGFVCSAAAHLCKRSTSDFSNCKNLPSVTTVPLGTDYVDACVTKYYGYLHVVVSSQARPVLFPACDVRPPSSSAPLVNGLRPRLRQRTSKPFDPPYTLPASLLLLWFIGRRPTCRKPRQQAC